MKARSLVFKSFIVCVDFQSLVLLIDDDHCLVAVEVIDVADLVEGKNMLRSMVSRFSSSLMKISLLGKMDMQLILFSFIVSENLAKRPFSLNTSVEV